MLIELTNEQEVQAMETQEMAEVIYVEVFGHIDNREIRQRKTGEIADWLADGDLDGTETASELSIEWREYDPEAAPEED